MNSWSVLLFFSLVVIGGALIDMLAAGTGLTDTANNLNPLINSNQLTLSDVSLGENNPIGQSFGGNILISPSEFKAWVNSIFMNYSWLEAPNIKVDSPLKEPISIILGFSILSIVISSPTLLIN